MGQSKGSQDCISQTQRMDREMKTKACTKLHIQLGRLNTDRLHGLLKDAKVLDKEVFDLVADVEKACDTCNRFKKLTLQPVVGFALAKRLIGNGFEAIQQCSLFTYDRSCNTIQFSM